MEKQIIDVPEFAGWSKSSTTPVSFVVKANGLVFVSGIPPLDPDSGSFSVQDVAAAGSSFQKVVRCTVYVTNAAYFVTINEIYGKFFPRAPSARIFVVVGSWPAPFDVEIECTALG
jgi:2-iminobutanoate/2-iminopropanoate deaminase